MKIGEESNISYFNYPQEAVMVLEILAGVISGLICAGILELVKSIRTRRASKDIEPNVLTEEYNNHTSPTILKLKTKKEIKPPMKLSPIPVKKKIGILFLISLFISLFLGTLTPVVIEEIYPELSNYKELISFVFILTFTAFFWVFFYRRDSFNLRIPLNRAILSPIIGFVLGAVSAGLFSPTENKVIQADSSSSGSISDLFFVILWTILAWFYLGRFKKNK